MKRGLILVGLLVACGTPAPTPTPTPQPTVSVQPVSGDPCLVGGQVYCVSNPDVSFATRAQTICRNGWAASVRPPVSYTEPLKQQQFTAEHLTGSLADYEEDHRLAIEGGGHPSDSRNLSPESHAKSFSKDAAENRLRQQLCSVPTADAFHAAQVAFVQTWLTTWPGYR